MRGKRHLVLMGLCAHALLLAVLAWSWGWSARGPVQLALQDGPRVVHAQSEDSCEASADKIASPGQVIIGDTATVTMSVRARCERLDLPVHAVLAVDNSYAMGGPRMANLREAVSAFVDAIDLESSRMGVLAFYGFVDLLSELSRDEVALRATGDSFFPRRGSNQELALRGAADIIRRGRDLPGAEDVTEVIVLMSGSDPDDPEDTDDAAMRATAQAIKDEGILLITVAMSGDADFQLLEELATSPEQFYIESEGILYAELMDRIAGDTAAVRLEGAQFRERLPGNMELVWGSDNPPGRTSGEDLLWAWSIWPAEGITITYELEPQELGRHPVSLGATVELRFDRGPARELTFPVPEIDVIPPPTLTPTPTATPTATPIPTATPVLLPAYLPIALQRYCKPDPRGADFALVLDVSSSMLERAAEGAPKLTLATLAASTFVDALALPADRAAVVAFHGRPVTMLDLTGSRSALQVALAGLFGEIGTGSRIDLGIAAAERLLRLGGSEAYPGPMPPRWTAPGRRKVMVLLTDGLADPAGARLAASGARSRGVTIYAIGLGDRVDDELLIELAGVRDRYRLSPDGADLEAIYLEIASDPGCP